MSNGRQKHRRRKSTTRPSTGSTEGASTHADANSSRHRTGGLRPGGGTRTNLPTTMGPTSVTRQRLANERLIQADAGGSRKVLRRREAVQDALPASTYRKLRTTSVEDTQLRVGGYEILRVNKGGSRNDLVLRQPQRRPGEAATDSGRDRLQRDLNKHPLPENIYLEGGNREETIATAREVIRQLRKENAQIPRFNEGLLRRVPGKNAYSYPLPVQNLSSAAPRRVNPDRPVRRQRRPEQDSQDTNLKERQGDGPVRDPSDLGIPIMDVSTFLRGTKSPLLKRIKSRTSEFQELTRALEVFHNEKTSYLTNLRQNKAQLNALGKRKSELLAEVKARKDEIFQREQAIKHSSDQDAIRQYQDEIRWIQYQIENANEFISDTDKAIIERLDIQKALGDEFSQKAKAAVEKLNEVNNRYMALKRQSSSSTKRDTLDVLQQQLQRYNPQRDIQELREQAWSVPHKQQLAKPSKQLQTDSVNEVFEVETNGPIGESQNRKGFAKKAVTMSDPVNDTGTLLGLTRDNEDTLRTEWATEPHLIARQVATSRIEQALEAGNIAPEVFSVHEDGTPIGISGMASGTQAMRLNEEGKRVYKIFDVENNGNLQRNLADLQVIDALTGQKDRHLQNVFIDAATGKVTGIDNDMAFPPDNQYHVDNPSSNELINQFTIVNNELTFNQEFISEGMAEKLLTMTPESLREVLQGQAQDLERLSEQEIDAAVERLSAMQKKVRELKSDNKLIKDSDWGPEMFKKMTENGTISKSKYSNYVAKMQNEPNDALDLKER